MRSRRSYPVNPRDAGDSHRVIRSLRVRPPPCPARGEAGHRSGNVRLAVGPLDQATASQDRRVTTASRPGPSRARAVAVAPIAGRCDSSQIFGREELPRTGRPLRCRWVTRKVVMSLRELRYLGTACRGRPDESGASASPTKTPQLRDTVADPHRNPTDETAHSGTLVMPVKGTENSRSAASMRVSWAVGAFPAKCFQGDRTPEKISGRSTVRPAPEPDPIGGPLPGHARLGPWSGRHRRRLPVRY